MITSWIPSNDYKNKTNPSLDAIRCSLVLVCVFGLLTWKYDTIMKAVLRTGLSRSFCLFCPVQETNSYQPKPNYCPYTTKPHETSPHKNMYAFSSLQINKIQQNKLIFALRGLTHRSRVLWPYTVGLLIQITCGRHIKTHEHSKLRCHGCCKALQKTTHDGEWIKVKFTESKW